MTLLIVFKEKINSSIYHIYNTNDDSIIATLTTLVGIMKHLCAYIPIYITCISGLYNRIQTIDIIICCYCSAIQKMWINCICLVLQIHLQIAESYQVSEPFTSYYSHISDMYMKYINIYITIYNVYLQMVYTVNSSCITDMVFYFKDMLKVLNIQNMHFYRLFTYYFTVILIYIYP